MNENNIIKQIKRTVLIVDDEFINQEILKEILGDVYDVITADNGKEALDVVRASLTPISLILLDINMPIMNGFEFIQEIKADDDYKRIPIIVLTGEKSSEIKSLDLGAVDFITKPYDLPEIIKVRVRRAIELSEDRTILTESERDEATGAYNKHMFYQYMKKIDKYNPDGVNDLVVIGIQKYLIYRELNGFEQTNKNLRKFVDILKRIVRDNEGIVGRIVHDYFCLYATHVDNPNIMSSAIIEAVKNEVDSSMMLSFGVYTITDKTESPESRVGKAKDICDEAMDSQVTYIKVYDEEAHKKALFNEKLLADLPTALQEGQFKVYFQPKVYIQSDKPRIVGAEALVRWIHPTLGFIPPGLFIPLLEENGVVRQVDSYVWNEAARQIKEWLPKFGDDFYVSMNVSRIDMYDPNINSFVSEIAKKHGLSPNNLSLEITESAYNSETAQMLQVINDLRAKGFRIEVDDFGSGYSSLNAIATLPFDVLKLDMKFVREMDSNPKMVKIVEIIEKIAKSMGVPLVAEGCETKEQMETLKKFGYEMVQGYYYSKPLPAKEFEEFYERWNKKC
ncbi:MAG: EAL domain-containing protein [Bacilli bacterium]|nr:EAL domain-containing protein [Bacilli bacterium]